MTRPRTPRIAILGGGIAGLAAAFELSSQQCHVTLYEASGRLGGKIRSAEIGDRRVDVGPDAFIARTPWAVQLCEELGLGAQLIAPAKSSAYVFAHGELRPLPSGLVLGIPTDFDALAASGIISDAGVEHARNAGQSATRFDPGHDESVGAVVRRSLGDEIVDYLVDPMVGGINAGHVDQLSISAATPQFAVAAARHESLVEGLRSQGLGGNVLPDTPIFQSLPGGTSQLVNALVNRLGTVDRVQMLLRHPASVTSCDERSVVVTSGGGDHHFDAVVVALPANPAATAVEQVASDVARQLRSIRYSSVALTTFRFRSDDVPCRLDKGGFLVPRPENLLMSACTYFSAKWPHIANRDEVLLRVSAGRIDDERIDSLDDAELVEALRGDLKTTMGISAPPLETLVTRYPHSFPQYEPGHLGLVDDIERSLRIIGPIFPTGAAFRGIGIPACVYQGRNVALDALTLAKDG